MRQKEIMVDQVIKTFNDAIHDYLEKKIDYVELRERISNINKTDIHELLVRTGNALVVVAMECVDNLSYIAGTGSLEGVENKDQWLKEYYKEANQGIPPHDTKMKFTFRWEASDLQVDLKYNQSTRQSK
jgi:hypothetical protein